MSLDERILANAGPLELDLALPVREPPPRQPVAPWRALAAELDRDRADR